MAIITGTSGNDSLIGTNANDTFRASAGNDTIDGLAGIDTVDYSNLKTTYIFYDVVPGTISKRFDQKDQISNIEIIRANTSNYFRAIDARSGTNANSSLYVSLTLPPGNEPNVRLTGTPMGDFSMRAENFKQVFGSLGSDTIIGNWENNELNGHEGNDTIKGLGGDDTIVGGLGDDVNDGGAGNDAIMGGLTYDHRSSANSRDTLTGGAGGDQFHMGQKFVADIISIGSFYTGTGFATITDFETGIDTIVLYADAPNPANEFVFGGGVGNYNTIYLDTNANGIVDTTVDNLITVLQTGTFNPNTDVQFIN